MDEGDRRAVLAAGSAVAFKMGDVLFDVGQPVETVHFPVSGAFSCTIPLDGASVEAVLIGREGAIGLLTVNGPIRAFGRVRAEADGTAIAVPAATLGRLIFERASLRQAVAHHGARFVGQIAKAVACNALHRLQPRLATWLLRFADRVEGRDLPLTQAHMSEMLGVSRTTMNAVAQGLQAKGLVRYTRGRLDILDRKGLEGLACDCYRTDGFREG